MGTQSRKSEKRSERKHVVDLDDDGGSRKLVYAIGAIGGLLLGALLVRGFEGTLGRGAAERIRRAAGERMSPGRGRRTGADDGDVVELEDRVLDAFLADDVLSERPIDVGAVAPGIVELSGVVWSRDEIRHALASAQAVRGVQTVLNRLEVEDDQGRWALDPEDAEEERSSGGEWTGLRVGMGSRRQGRSTDPSRHDDSHHQREVAVERADRAQFEEEGYHHRPRVAARGYDPRDPGSFAEDDLDNQSPYGKHATPAPPPREALNSRSRVGEGMKPGTELRLEGADVPVKPHQRQPGDEGRGV